MAFSKTTFNYAKRRNIELWEDGGVLYITVDAENNDSCAVEYEFIDGAFFFIRQHDSRLEDLPNWIEDELGLRELINYIYLILIK